MIMVGLFFRNEQKSQAVPEVGLVEDFEGGLAPLRMVPAVGDYYLITPTFPTNKCLTLDSQGTGGFEICIDGLSIWRMRIGREIGRGTSVQALRE